MSSILINITITSSLISSYVKCALVHLKYILFQNAHFPHTRRSPHNVPHSSSNNIISTQINDVIVYSSCLLLFILLLLLNIDMCMFSSIQKCVCLVAHKKVYTPFLCQYEEILRTPNPVGV